MAPMTSASVYFGRALFRYTMDGTRTTSSFSPRYFSDGGKGRVFSEEERAAESIYIKKMERDQIEKAKKKAEKEKAEKEAANKGPGGNQS